MPPSTSSTPQPQNRWSGLWGRLLLLGPSGLWLTLMLVLPTLLITELSILPNFRPGSPAPAYGLGNYLQILDPLYLKVLGRSLSLACISTTLCLFLGYPVAYWIALKSPVRWRTLLLVAFILPLWTSSLLRAYAWITILRPSGVLNTLLGAIGLPKLQLLNSLTAILIGLTYSYLPYMVLVLYASLEKLDRRLLEAAADLGAKPWATFWRVTLPQTMPGIAGGSLLVFISTFGDFTNPELLGGASSMTISRLIYAQFLGASRNWGLGSAFSMVLILGVSLALALLIRFGDRQAATET
jgi:spermidine/putrescine transport system permease protein